MLFCIGVMFLGLVGREKNHFEGSGEVSSGRSGTAIGSTSRARRASGQVHSAVAEDLLPDGLGHELDVTIAE